jgi:gluconolactonase
VVKIFSAMPKSKTSFFLLSLIILLQMSNQVLSQVNYPSIGKIVVEDPSFTAIIDPKASIDVLATGFVWSEGPTWVKNGSYLLFSDVPTNTVHKWHAKEGLSIFLKPSGYTGVGKYSGEPGSNGLIINNKGNLVSCEHGDRRVSEMNLTIGGKTTLAHTYMGGRLNSPNDICQHSDGSYYFTDPPYGLPSQQDTDPMKELKHNGIYKIHPTGALQLLSDKLSRPNGLAFSPDFKTLYVAQSDDKAPYIYSFKVKPNGSLEEPTVFYDTTILKKQGLNGNPDGLKVDVNGNLFCTGPGGIFVLNAQAKLLGRIHTGEYTSNCAFGEKGDVLYITADAYLCKIQTKTKGCGL